VSEPFLVIETAAIRAPIERVFALSTRVEIVQKTLGMKPVDGVTAGHVVSSSRVVWSGWKFLLPTQHHTLITGYTSPHVNTGGQWLAWFQDSQERGRFAFFQHDHFFSQDTDGITRLRDEVRFSLPYGPLGRFIGRWILVPHVTHLCRKRFALIAALAEGEGWREWVELQSSGATGGSSGL
jgi:ligand-binding SRPBCC domain-containing protein